MKGKLLNLKLAIVLLLAIAAGFCFATTKTKSVNEKPVVDAAYQVATIYGEEFSAEMGGGVIFSAEKVLVNSAMKHYPHHNDELCDDVNCGSIDHTCSLCNDPKYLVPEDLTTPASGDRKFYAKYDNDSATKEYYNFRDIANGAKPKTIVEDGKYVTLKNKKNGDPSKPIYTEGNTNLQEAVMISLGVYIKEDRIQIANEDNTVFAGISSLEVSLRRNGENQKGLGIRNIKPATGGLYFDFALLIRQLEDDSNEGFYELNFKYMINGRLYNTNFSFFMINESSYTQNVNPDGKEYGYNAKPTLGWTETSLQFAKSSTVDGYVRYYVGESGLELVNNIVSFPTITYDYTRYKLQYTHTANQRNTNYNLEVNYSGSSATMSVFKTALGKTEKTEYGLYDYKSTDSTSLVTLMLTEPGAYVFTYEKLYRGSNAVNAPKMEQEAVEIKLSIHGMSLFYSKENFEGAKMQYFEIATKGGNQVDLIVPTGYKKDSDQSLKYNTQQGFMYSLVESDEREGNILTTNSENSLINNKLKSTTTIHGSSDDFEYLITNINDYSNETNLEAILNTIKYVDTNQGSLWLSGNDVFTDKSFYFYSPVKITDGEKLFKDSVTPPTKISAAEKYTNVTSFNKKGYYLVFLQIDPNGIKDDSVFKWQIFAFQYTSIATNIVTEAIDDKGTSTTTDDSYEVIEGGKFTNKNVRISWKKPGLFDRKISPYYYSVTNENLSKSDLLNRTKNSLEYIETNGYCYAYLGEDVEENNFVKYLIYLENEGDSATYKIFTIDRQQISGIQAFLIKTMYAENYEYYSYARDTFNNKIAISNSITDNYATIYWNEKKSGATIHAEYSYTPFSINSNEISSIIQGNQANWIPTNYELGNTVSGIDLYKSSSEYSVSSDCVLFNQGLYLITLRDSAGNKCDYAFVIDRTNAYFKVGDSFVSNSEAVFGADVEYNIGDYKVFEIDINNPYLSSEVQTFIKEASDNNLSNLKTYYQQAGTNVNAISNYFQKTSNSGKYYFTVPNLGVEAYNDLKVDNKITQKSGTIRYVQTTDGYYSRKVYIAGENHRFSTNRIYDSKQLTNNSSHVVIEINKDNARGYVYYSNDINFVIPAEGVDSSYKKLGYGSDIGNGPAYGQGENNGLNGAKATSANHVVFTWNMGTTNFVVADVSYQFYNLQPGSYVDDKYYFYKEVGDPVYIYQDNEFKNGAKKIDGTSTGMIQFNSPSNSRAGLYKITRNYASNVGLGEDEQSKNYYFIVDRNGVIDTGVGGSIKILLMETETEFNKFNISGITPKSFKYEDETVDSGSQNSRVVEADYNVYLETNKLPATLNVPVGKYLDELGHSSRGYNAGRLNVYVYFKDIYNQIQLEEYNEDSAFLIYKAYGIDNAGKTSFSVNIFDYLPNINIELRQRLTLGNSAQGEWLFLPGDYIIRITDNVIDGLDKRHEKIIGLSIVNADKGPTIDISTGFSKDNLIKLNPSYDEYGKNEKSNDYEYKYTATASQEFLEVKIPEYMNDQQELAQVDPSYFVIYKNGIPYANHPYSNLGGDAYEQEGKYFKSNSDGSKSIFLETDLRKEDGSIDDNTAKSIEFTITVRYKLNNGPGEEKTEYKNCYVYYKDNNGVSEQYYYYQKTYKIVIDRKAPEENIIALNNKDGLVKEYNKLFNTSEMFEDTYYETASNIYFTKQYAKYYSEKNPSYIYVYQVNEDTIFNKSDVSEVFVKTIGNVTDLSTLNLPLTEIDKYYKNSSVNYYKELFTVGGVQLVNNTLYEIIERDAAGNTTQYVIHYNPAGAEIGIPILVKPAEGADIGVSKPIIIGVDSLDYSIFGLEANGNSSISNENFFKIEIKQRSTTLKTILTTATTDYSKLASEIVETITDQTVGEFTILITTRKINQENNVYYININLYDQNNIKRLTASDMVVNDADGYKLEFAKINKQSDDGNLWFFGEEIKIQASGDEYKEYTIVGERSDGEIKYYQIKPSGERTFIQTLGCDANTTYSIELKPNVGDPDSYIFSTSGLDFVMFDKTCLYETDTNELIYHSFKSVEFKFNPTIFTTTEIKQKVNDIWANVNPSPNFSETTEDISGVNYTVYNLNATFQPDGSGEKQEYMITLTVQGKTQSYHFVIDSRTAEVAIRDLSSEKQDIISYFQNDNYQNVKSTQQPGVGQLNLQWIEMETIANSEYFDYEYVLHELMDDGSYREPQLHGYNFNISTSSDSSGCYVFEIKVCGKDGTYLGNKLYAFEVAENSKNFYIVRYDDDNSDFDGEISSFNLNELYPTLKDEIKSKYAEINETLNFPLYISNKALKVVLLDSKVSLDTNPFHQIIEGSDFYIYKLIKEDSFDAYIGVLKVTNSSRLVSNVVIKVNETGEFKVGNNVEDVQTNFEIFTSKNNSVVIKAQDVFNRNGLLGKNKLKLEVLYNNILVNTVDFKAGLDDNDGYEIVGNGKYSFRFVDLAGNVNEFKQDIDKLNLYIVREVVVTLNDSKPIQNAYYNSSVKLTIVESGKYAAGSISINATLNGKNYSYGGFSPNYIFSGYGTFRVEITALRTGSDEIYKTIVVFSIIDIKEAKKSIDLSNLKSTQILSFEKIEWDPRTNSYKVLKSGDEVTKHFLELFKENSNLTYETIMKNSHLFDVIAGKQSFLIKYRVEDGIYPMKNSEFMFTLNNEDPSIQCSIEKGKTTKKGFSIKFNAASLYDEVGKSYLYINDRLIAEIDYDSENVEQVIETTFKMHGEGDYYVQLISSSGVVLDSYKITIKEPLNTMAIIVIVVVSGVVLTVVVTVIVLRRKMRIR